MAAGAGQDDSAFWDLVYVLYPEAVEAVGLATLRQLTPPWKLLEAGLMVRNNPQCCPAWSRSVRFTASHD